MSLLDRLWYALDPLSMIADYVDGKMLEDAISWLQAKYPLVIKTSYGKSSGNYSGADNIADAARLKEYYK